MHRLLSALAVAAILCSASACSSTPPPSEAGIEGNKIISALRDLSGMYREKNISGFMSMISGRFPEHDAFEGSVREVFSRYKSVRFTVESSKMFVIVDERGVTKAEFNWESAWESPGGSMLRNSGRSTFVFEPKTAKLISIDGRNPFIPQKVEQGKP